MQSDMWYAVAVVLILAVLAYLTPRAPRQEQQPPPKSKESFSPTPPSSAWKGS
jgi:hypothetical protein